LTIKKLFGFKALVLYSDFSKSQTEFLCLTIVFVLFCISKVNWYITLGLPVFKFYLC